MKLVFFGRICAIDRKIFRGVFPNLGLYQPLEDGYGHIWQKSASERKADDIRSFCQNQRNKVIVAEVGGKVLCRKFLI